MQQVAQQMTWDVTQWARKTETSERDEEFAALVHRHSTFVFRIAYAVLRNVQDAEDAAQDAFLKVYRKKAWQEMEDERAYLARVTWRIAIDRRPGSKSSEPVPELSSREQNPEQSATAVEGEALVRGLIDALPDDLRHPLLLSAVEEMKSAEIAVVLGLPEGTVRNRIFRARQLLRQKLEGLLEVRRER